MRKFIGFLCYLCLISAIGFGGYYLYLNTSPFYRGAEVRYYNYDYYNNNNSDFWNSNNTSGFLQKLSRNGIDKSDASLLGGYVAGISPIYVYRGLNAAGYIFNSDTISKTSMSESIIALCAVADANGKVVATYPSRLLNKVGRVQINDEVGWRTVLGQYIKHQQIIKVFPLKDPQGQLGSIAFVIEPSATIAIIPPQSRVNDRIPAFTSALLAIVSLLLFVVLLPVWVALDANSCGMRAFAWTSLVVLTGPFGLLAYFIARPPSPKTCPNCGEPVFSKYKRCPACGTLLLNKCPVCGRKMKPGWLHCPSCVSEHPDETQQQPEYCEPDAIRIQPEIDNALPDVSKHLNLKVTVVDSENHMPIADAIVSVNGQTMLSGVTGKSGVFEAKAIVSGIYEVTAAKQGFDSALAEIDVIQDGDNSVQLVLKEQPGTIGGRVLDRSNLEPISGARVFIDSSRLDRSATTDIEGVCTLDDIPAGPYTVCADADGHIFQTRLAEVEPGRHVTVDFALEAAADPQKQEIKNEAE